MLRSIALTGLAAALALLPPAACAQRRAAGAEGAQAYPARPIRIIVAFPPGSSNDMLARLVGGKLAERYDSPVVVDNRAGANGIIGTDLAARATPDGYTLLVVSTSHTMNAAVRTLPYDPVKSFTAVSMLATGPNMLAAHPAFPASSVKELIPLAKAKPGGIGYATSGTGGINHFGGELLARIAGIRLLHVPFKGGAPSLTAVVGGQVPLIVGTLPLCLPQVRAGRIRALGVGSSRRSALLPNVPTIAESGAPGYEFNVWWGMLAPAGTPPGIVAKLAGDVGAILGLPEATQRLAPEGAEPKSVPPGEFSRILASDTAKWVRIAREANIRAE
ncbi:MAG: tripartite tricarboxylate transporter substrate binding protein [Burkholderiales bacterium]|nr:tripartite tricarboxylate transporter substrate binding protein [Burkholderiales bacterium]